MCRKGTVRKPDRQVGIEHEQAFTDRLYKISGSTSLTAVSEHLLVTGLILSSRNTILLERPTPPPALQLQTELVSGMSVMYITDTVKRQYHAYVWEGEKRGAPGPIDNIRKMPPRGPADQVS
jgi:hypothetical protein